MGCPTNLLLLFSLAAWCICLCLCLCFSSEPFRSFTSLTSLMMAPRHLDNPSPVLIAPRPPRSPDSPGSQEGWSSADVFELLRTIVDPEHPHTLEELGVVKEDDIVVTDVSSTRKHSVNVHFTPTVPHCSMATLIGLCIRVRLLREMPSTF